MGTLLGGERWNDEITPLDDDWYAYKTEKELEDDPVKNWDYVPEKYRTNKDDYPVVGKSDDNDT